MGQLKEARGAGALVTQQDLMEIPPRTMALHQARRHHRHDGGQPKIHDARIYSTMSCR